MPTNTEPVVPDRITWTQGSYALQGQAGGLGLFTISWGTRRQDAMWVLGTKLPVASSLLGQHYVDRDAAKVAAERLLEGFIRKVSEPVAAKVDA